MNRNVLVMSAIFVMMVLAGCQNAEMRRDEGSLVGIARNLHAEHRDCGN